MAEEGWVQVALPQAVEQLIQQICREQNQTLPGTDVRYELALLGEEEAVNLLRKIAASTIKKTLSAFIIYMIRKAKQHHSNNNNIGTPSPQKVPRVSPFHSPASSYPASQSRLVYPPSQGKMGSPSDKSNSPKPRTRQSYAAIPIPPSRFTPYPSFTSPAFSSNRIPERPPLLCNPNPFELLSPQSPSNLISTSSPTTKQSYSSPSTPPLKKPFNIAASSFPPLIPPSDRFKNRPSTSQQNQIPKGDYDIELPKDSWNFILWIEHEHQHMTDTLSLVKQLIPPGWEHPKAETLKTQKFYEFILVDTDLILVTHMPCSHDPNRIDYSKVVIKQILTLSQWKSAPWITRNFSQPFNPQFYNYYDYVEAWDRFLLFQNNIYRHTWFFCFDMYRKKDIMIPRWFIDWWESYGPEAMILPPELLRAYETFKKEPDIPHLKNFPHLLQFYYRFPDLPWIIRWEYRIERHLRYPFPMLTRKFILKWWNKFNFDHICQELQKNPSSSQTDSATFLLEKSQVQCLLASVSDRKQLKEQLLEAASQISDDEDDTMIKESSSPNFKTHLELFQDSQDPYEV